MEAAPAFLPPASPSALLVGISAAPLLSQQYLVPVPICFMTKRLPISGRNRKRRQPRAGSSRGYAPVCASHRRNVVATAQQQKQQQQQPVVVCRRANTIASLYIVQHCTVRDTFSYGMKQERSSRLEFLSGEWVLLSS